MEYYIKFGAVSGRCACGIMSTLRERLRRVKRSCVLEKIADPNNIPRVDVLQDTVSSVLSGSQISYLDRMYASMGISKCILP